MPVAEPRSLAGEGPRDHDRHIAAAHRVESGQLFIRFEMHNVTLFQRCLRDSSE